MLGYVICLFVKRLSQKAIQRRSQPDRLVKIKVFKLRRDADDIPCSITLRSAGGESFHSAGPTTAKIILNLVVSMNFHCSLNRLNIAICGPEDLKNRSNTAAEIISRIRCLQSRNSKRLSY